MPLHDNLKPDTTIEAQPIAPPDKVDLKNSLIEELHKIFTGEEAGKHLTEYLTKKKDRPAHWKRLANAPYYRERFALELKVVLDAMVKDGQDREYYYRDFPDMSRNTIYLRVNQARLYLLEELDFDGRYHKLFQLLTISRERTGVRISFHKDIRLGTPLMPAQIVNNASRDDLRTRIDKFLESAEVGQKFEEKNLNMEPDEVESLRNSFIGVENFVANITEVSIKIVKIA